jgi:anti-sigma factor RsiW
MLETMCSYSGRDDLLIAYLYDDIDSADRVTFRAHLAACGRCSRELAELRSVRTTLSVWTPPEPAFAHEPRATSSESRATSPEPGVPSRSWHDVPAWAQVAAAILVLGVSIGIANIDVRHDNAGWTVRTGWWNTRATLSNESAASQSPSATRTAATSASPAPWRADLAALEQQLRTEFRAVPARAVPAAATSDAELQRRVRSILDESERRQERELALRVAEVMKDVNAQRQADLVKIDRSLGFIQSSTYGEQMKQREVVNYLLKVSQKQ